jgi:D-sedoheptulose 7-phosphate isomerase
MSIFERAVDDAIAMLTAIHVLREPLERAAAIVEECILSGHKLLVCGNGGSAADGADFATEFACRFTNDRQPFPAINLTACGSLLTATANDYGIEELFARPVRAFGQPGDVLIALTTSGNSANILAALREGERLGLKTIALLGRDGGKAKGLATVDLIVPSTITARIQEGHKFLLHTLCELIEPSLASAPPKPGA